MLSPQENNNVVCGLAFSIIALLEDDPWLMFVHVVKASTWKIHVLVLTRQRTREGNSFLMSTWGINPTWGCLSRRKGAELTFSNKVELCWKCDVYTLQKCFNRVDSKIWIKADLGRCDLGFTASWWNPLHLWASDIADASFDLGRGSSASCRYCRYIQ